MTPPRSGVTRRAIVAVVLAVSALWAPVGPATLGASSLANGVTWSIDHTAKTITADVRITITPTCATPQFQPAKFGQERMSWCTVDAAIAEQIKANIEKIWNGHQYYCYDIVVKVDIKVDDDPYGPDPRNRVKVRIDKTAAGATNVVSHVKSRQTGAPWDGNSPSDAVRVVNNGTGSSTWVYPPGAQGTNLYAHEAGHILGLDDAYEEYVDANGNVQLRTRPGAPEDLMSDQNNSNIDKSTLRRMVERAGYTKLDLKCNYRIDQPSFGGRIFGQKCDPLGGQWIAQGTYSIGKADGRQEWIITVDEVTKRGNFIYTDHQVSEFAVGAKIITDGTANGEASFTIDDELRVRFHLVEKKHTYVATAPGGHKGHDQNAPLTSIDLVWQPIGRC